MVAEVVLSVMSNRSDRRFTNLSNSRALEAVEPIRTRRADFHQGPEHSNKAPYRGRIYDCNRLRPTPTNGFALGAGSIVRWEKLPMTDGCKSRPARAVAGRAGTESCGRRGDAGSEA